MKRKKVVVIGGGFAGIQFVRNINTSAYEVLLIDKVNHHQFQPLFYQVAASQIEPSSISFPLRKIFQKKKNTEIRLAEVTQVVPDKNLIETNIGAFDYDLLVIATGCKTNFYKNVELEKNAFSLKTTYDAIKIRNAVIENFEALLSAKPEEKDSLLNIIIVGAGPTGVELAGSFAEMKNNILPKDYPGVDFSELKITLVESSDSTLSKMSKLAQDASYKYLDQLGVSILTNTLVSEYDGNTVVLNNNTKIKSKNVIWTAGVTGNVIDGLPKAEVIANGRIKTDRYNCIEGYQNIYALGDIAYMETPLFPQGHPQVANVAINQAKNLASNFNALAKGKQQKAYEYKDLGTMATIGKNKAVVDLPFIKFKGHLAWFVWMFLHLMLILSVRNKLIIFINWAWNYMTKDSALRLILKESSDKKE